MTILSRLRGESAGNKEPVVEVVSVGTEQAWKMLDVVTGWVRASEVKATAALAADGVIGGAVFNLTKDVVLDTAEIVLIICCLVSVLASGLCAGACLIPRLWVRENPQNLIYFNHVARRYTRYDDYRSVFQALVVDESRLVDEISAQAWVNSRIARRKFLWSGWAIILFFMAVLFVAALMILRA
ncbi:Pycsar system effector family protein [Kribbella sp. NPDC058693]|uniref:Pycsar system effector family protein n=1 Tax=Kribbella sp. NPDC058693 TaxID=3346602 RepID=UPI00364C255E